MSRRTIASTLGLALLVMLTGCVMPDQMSAVQKDVADVEQQMRRMQREQDEAFRRIAEASDEGDEAAPVSRAELAELMLRLEELSRSISVNDAQMQDLGRRVDRMSQEVQQVRAIARAGGSSGSPLVTNPGYDDPGSGAVPGVTRDTGGEVPDPESLYNTAYADFSKGNYALAVSGFEEYQQRFSESALADNALYWVGECHFSQADFATAVRAFDRLLELYPRSDKAAAANLKKALAYLEQNQIRRGIVQLRYVVSSYPGTDEARLARDKLTGLGATAD